MRLRLNLSTRTYVDRRKLNIFTFGAVAILFLFLILSIRQVMHNSSEIARLRKQLNKEAPADREVPTAQYQALLAHIKFANSLIDQKRFNWLGMLNRLEAVVPDGVALSAVEPDSRNSQLKLAGVSRNFQNLRKFMENLEDSHVFTDVYLLGQGVAKGPGSQSGISFSISCKTDFRNL